MIDFGLAQNTTLSEDKAVDLYVLSRAIASLHSKQGELFDWVFEAYRKHSRHWSAVHNKFADVKARGRKRTMVG